MLYIKIQTLPTALTKSFSYQPQNQEHAADQPHTQSEQANSKKTTSLKYKLISMIKISFCQLFHVNRDFSAEFDSLPCECSRERLVCQGVAYLQCV